MWKAWGTTYVLGATLSSVSTTRFGIFIRLIPNWGIRWWLSTLKKQSLETEEGLRCVLWYWPHSDIAVDGSHNARMSKARCILSEEKHSDRDSKKKKYRTLKGRTWVRVLTAYQAWWQPSHRTCLSLGFLCIQKDNNNANGWEYSEDRSLFKMFNVKIWTMCFWHESWSLRYQRRMGSKNLFSWKFSICLFSSYA